MNVNRYSITYEKSKYCSIKTQNNAHINCKQSNEFSTNYEQNCKKHEHKLSFFRLVYQSYELFSCQKYQNRKYCKILIQNPSLNHLTNNVEYLLLSCVGSTNTVENGYVLLRIFVDVFYLGTASQSPKESYKKIYK